MSTIKNRSRTIAISATVKRSTMAPKQTTFPTIQRVLANA